MESSVITRTISTIALAAIEGICMQKALMDNIIADEDLIGKIIMFFLNIDYDRTEKILTTDTRLEYKD